MSDTLYPQSPCFEKAEHLVSLLMARGKHIAFAESCTGGLLAAGLVAVPSASAVLDASYVTYANEAKTALCGVDPETLAAHGAVSEQVAAEMAAGAAHAAGAEIGASTSGIAGPSGGTPEKPVGTVCFGFSLGGCVRTETRHFGDLGRNAVRAAAVEFVYDTLISMLEAQGE